MEQRQGKIAGLKESWKRSQGSLREFWRQVKPLLLTTFDRQSPDSLSSVVSAFESQTTAVMVRTSPRNEHTILYTVTGILLLSFGLMSFAQLDQVVSGEGKVVPSGGSVFLSPLDKAIIKNIQVKVGDVVHKGQVLATMDPTFASADLAQMQQKAESDAAAVEREQAELADKPYTPTDTTPYAILQKNIYAQRQAELKSSLADFNARIASADSNVQQMQHDIDGYRQRLGVASQLEQMNVELEQKGFGSKLRTLTTTDLRVEIERQLADSTGQIAAARQTSLSLKALRNALLEKWRTDVASQLVTDKNDLDKSREDLKRAQKLKDLVELRAPIDGVVLQIGKVSAGSVTGTGTDSSEPVFTLVPLGGTVDADIDVEARDVGFIHVGDPVEIKLDAYRFLEHGTAKGVIKNITEGSFRVDPTPTNQPRNPYFQVRIGFTDVHLRNVPPDFRLIPGMTLVADVVTGHRTILSYLVESVMRTGKEAMREPS